MSSLPKFKAIGNSDGERETEIKTETLTERYKLVFMRAEQTNKGREGGKYCQLVS